MSPLVGNDFIFVVGPLRQLAVQLSAVALGGLPVLVSALRSDGPILLLLVVHIDLLHLDGTVGGVEVGHSRLKVRGKYLLGLALTMVVSGRTA
jgi:hypothetical protein